MAQDGISVQKLGKDKQGIPGWKYFVYDTLNDKQVTKTFRALPGDRRTDRNPGCEEGDRWASGIRDQLDAAKAKAQVDEIRHGGGIGTSLLTWTNKFIAHSAARSGPVEHGNRKYRKEQSIHLDQVRMTVKRAIEEGGIVDLADPQAKQKAKKWLDGLKKRNFRINKDKSKSEAVIVGEASLATKNHYLRRLKAISKYACNEGAFDIDPFSKIQSYNESKAETFYYSLHDLRRLVSDEMFSKPSRFMDADEDDKYDWYTFVCLCAYTGFREGTVVALTFSDIYVDNYDNWQWRIPSTKTKTRNKIITPIQPELVPIIKQLKDRFTDKKTGKLNNEKPLVGIAVLQSHTNGTISSTIQNYLKHAGVSIKGRPVHSFRNTLCGILYALNLSNGIIMDAVGHEDYKSSKGYADSAKYVAQELASEQWPQGTFRGELFLRRSPPEKDICVKVLQGENGQSRLLPNHITEPTLVSVENPYKGKRYACNKNKDKNIESVKEVKK